MRERHIEIFRYALPRTLSEFAVGSGWRDRSSSQPHEILTNMSITVSILFEPIWKEIAPHLHVVECAPDGGHDDPRIRIEFLGLAEPTMHRLVMYEMPCVNCLLPNHPLRRRISDPWDAGRLYYAPACPIRVRIACSRGRAAELEYERFKTLTPTPAPQLALAL